MKSLLFVTFICLCLFVAVSVATGDKPKSKHQIQLEEEEAEFKKYVKCDSEQRSLQSHKIKLKADEGLLSVVETKMEHFKALKQKLCEPGHVFVTPTLETTESFQRGRGPCDNAHHNYLSFSHIVTETKRSISEMLKLIETNDAFVKENNCDKFILDYEQKIAAKQGYSNGQL